MTALSDGTLIADLSESSGHALARSADHGATWTDVLKTGQYRMLTPHSIAELDGEVYFVEYQVSPPARCSVPVEVADRARTWTVQTLPRVAPRPTAWRRTPPTKLWYTSHPAPRCCAA